jgi:hypothetical protein
MQDVFIEYMVKRQSTVIQTILKILLVIGAVVVAAAAMLFSGLLGEMLSFLGTAVAAGAIFGAYLLISGMNVEYEYSVTNGDLDVDQITAQRRRKRLVSVNCKEVEAFGRYKAEEHQNKTYQTKIMACDNPLNEELWYCVIRLKQSGTTLVVFNASPKMLDGIKRFLPRPIMHEAFKTYGTN